MGRGALGVHWEPELWHTEPARAGNRPPQKGEGLGLPSPPTRLPLPLGGGPGSGGRSGDGSPGIPECSSWSCCWERFWPGPRMAGHRFWEEARTTGWVRTSGGHREGPSCLFSFGGSRRPWDSWPQASSHGLVFCGSSSLSCKDTCHWVAQDGIILRSFTQLQTRRPFPG